MPRFFAMTSRGLNEVLEKEIIDLGFKKPLKGPGGIYFETNWAGAYKACLRLRSATRVLLPILDFPAYNPEELYHNIQKHDFTKYIDVHQTLAVESKVRDCGAFRDSMFVSLKVKDAVVDQFRDKTGERPDVDGERPDLKIVIRAVKNSFSVSIDISGDPLFKRGYRGLKAVQAPLKEHVAAGLIMATGWEGKTSVVDPMCGSGTFLIEAALMALKISPGTLRSRFGFQGLKIFKPEEFAEELDAAIADEVEAPEGLHFYGYDVDRDAVRVARENVKRAGLDELITIERHEVETLHRPAAAQSGMLLVNPPYGERLGDMTRLSDMYKDFAYVMKNEFKGWDCWVLSGNPELSAAMRLKAERRVPVFNGPIECRFLKYAMF